MRTRRASVLLLPVAIGLAPATAAAQTAGTPERPSTTVRTSILGDSDGKVLEGRTWRVRVRTAAPVTGNVEIRLRRSGRTVLKRTVALAPTEDGTASEAVVRTRAGAAGRVTAVSEIPTGQATVAAAKARNRSVTVIAARARPGSRGFAVRVLQRELKRKGYVIGRPGRYDARTGRAVRALHSVTGRGRSSVADADDFALLGRGGGTFKARFPGHGRHVEADISRQVIAFFGKDGRTVERIYPTSSGAPATPTIKGSFRIYRKDTGTNALGMIDAVYFIRGYAIHGFKSVPTYPASHGCLRVAPAEARPVYDWVRIGTRVDTYR